MNIQQFLECTYYQPKHFWLPVMRPGIICADGTALSVQASIHHYCTPKDNGKYYSEVEVGFPTAKPPDSWRWYSEDWNSPTKTIYPYIPVELVQEYIDLHGGIKDLARFSSSSDEVYIACSNCGAMVLKYTECSHCNNGGSND